MNNIVLSSLGHTWLFDIDGTIVKHNGYKTDGVDKLLPGVKEFWKTIPKNDIIILLTSRKNQYRDATIRFLDENGIRFTQIIFDLPYGERILVNDDKPNGLVCGHVLNLVRDQGIKEQLLIDSTL